MAKEDVFISTDVDKIIKSLKERGRVEVNDLAKGAGLPSKEVEKWCHVLEEQGMVKVDYHLTRMFVSWKGEKAKAAVPSISQAVLSPQRKESALDEKLGKILGEREAPSTLDDARMEEERQQLLGKTRSDSKPKEIVEMSEALKSKMSDINQKAREIEGLKENREVLVHNAYQPLAKRLETELDALEDRLRAKETQILKLRQRAIEVPDMISGVELDMLKLRDKEKEVRSSLNESTQKIQTTVQALRELQMSVSKNVDEIRRSVSRERSSLDEMEAGLTKLNEIEKEVRLRIKDTREKIEQENSRVSLMEESLEKLKGVETETRKKISEARARVDKDGARMGELEGEVNRLKKIDAWISAYQQAYEKKFTDFTAYVKENEEEFYGLREAVETGFVRKYLRELKELSDTYEFEVKQVLKKEEALNAKADSAKKDLSKMIQESKEISNRFEDLLKKTETTRGPRERLQRLEEKREKTDKELAEADKETAGIADEFAVLFKNRKA